MDKFIPRIISPEMVKEGYNNKGQGVLLGYIARPNDHEVTCRYRISTGGDPNKDPHEACSCRIGLWKKETTTERVINEMRKTAKRVKKSFKKKEVKRGKRKAPKL